MAKIKPYTNVLIAFFEDRYDVAMLAHLYQLCLTNISVNLGEQLYNYMNG